MTFNILDFNETDFIEHVKDWITVDNRQGSKTLNSHDRFVISILEFITQENIFDFQDQVLAQLQEYRFYNTWDLRAYLNYLKSANIDKYKDILEQYYKLLPAQLNQNSTPYNLYWDGQTALNNLNIFCKSNLIFEGLDSDSKWAWELLRDNFLANDSIFELDITVQSTGLNYPQSKLGRETLKNWLLTSLKKKEFLYDTDRQELEKLRDTSLALFSSIRTQLNDNETIEYLTKILQSQTNSFLKQEIRFLIKQCKRLGRKSETKALLDTIQKGVSTFLCKLLQVIYRNLSILSSNITVNWPKISPQLCTRFPHFNTIFSVAK